MYPSIGRLVAIRPDPVEGAQQMEENLTNGWTCVDTTPHTTSQRMLYYSTLSARRLAYQLEIGPLRAYN